MSSPTTKKGKRKCEGGGDAVRSRLGFRVRVRDFSLGFWAIRPSEFVGTRSKVVLLSEGFAWVPDLRSFEKLREVGDLSYLGFTLYLSVI